MSEKAPVPSKPDPSSRSTIVRRVLLSPRWYGRFLRRLDPARSVLLGYLTYVLVGAGLLALPISRRLPDVSLQDQVFVATSAVSTTGLSTVSVSQTYTGFGQLIILVLIQLGGIGYMTMGSFIALSKSRELSNSRSRIGTVVFSLPAEYRVDKFVRSVIKFTLVIEALGAIAFYAIFRSAGVESPLWSAVFHSVSSFCTAGFSLYDTSFEGYADHVPLNLLVAVLSYLGAMGFIVCIDFSRKWRGKVERVTLTTRIILTMTLLMAAASTAALFFTEPAFSDLSPSARGWASFFQAMSAMTTVGFNTVTMSTLSNASVLVLLVLMFVGASPSGTGGGVKCTTISAIGGVMSSTLRGSPRILLAGHAIPLPRIWSAVSTVGFYIVALTAGTWLLELAEPSEFRANLFEAASALGTVGLSLGITSGLSVAGKWIVIALMFLGRVGPVTFSLALFARPIEEEPHETADLAV